MTRRDIKDEYFRWLFNFVCEDDYPKELSYKRLLLRLHNIEFRYLLPRDQNRADDGINLRYRFAIAEGYEASSRTIQDILDGPCSVLEMLIALSIKCEEDMMDDPMYGDRTSQWFWSMVINLGLGSMADPTFDRLTVDNAIARFLDRRYEPNGKGGLFTIRNCSADLRNVEIWWQLCWYIDSITDI